MSTPEDEKFVAECEARAAKATPGPWKWVSPRVEYGFWTIGIKTEAQDLAGQRSKDATSADNDLMTRSIVDVPNLCRLWREERADNAALHERIAALEPEAKAWRDGWEVIRELRERVIPCGHKIEDLIRGGEGSVTKCGACLAAKQAAKVIEKPSIELDPHADCTLCNGTGWINGVVGSSCDMPNVGIATTLQMDEMPS